MGKLDSTNPILIDNFGREVKYLRLSVTDRCNLRCVYCVHKEGLKFLTHEDILSYEEMLFVIDVLVGFGINKIRLTGGEPFARKGFAGFLEDIRKKHPSIDLRITTNATYIAEHIELLKDIQINGLNISFDTFNPATFKKISGTNFYEHAKKGLDLAVKNGLPVKINAVALKDINSQELPLFIDFAIKHEVDVRFIEFMPLGGKEDWTKASFWPASEIIASAEKLADLKAVPYEVDSNKIINGPASMFTLNNGKGRFGVITPVTCHFCDDCNRLRVTSDGKFRTCLFSDNEFSFKEIIRSQVNPSNTSDKLMELLLEALVSKPLGYKLLENRKDINAVISRDMSSIGG